LCTFINGNVSPNGAAGLTVATFALIFGAFGLIAIRVNLDKNGNKKAITKRYSNFPLHIGHSFFIVLI
jgi:hypothetical protein